jgi:hypothetical protein
MSHEPRGRDWVLKKPAKLKKPDGRYNMAVVYMDGTADQFFYRNRQDAMDSYDLRRMSATIRYLLVVDSDGKVLAENVKYGSFAKVA